MGLFNDLPSDNIIFHMNYFHLISKCALSVWLSQANLLILYIPLKAQNNAQKQAWRACVSSDNDCIVIIPLYQYLNIDWCTASYDGHYGDST